MLSQIISTAVVVIGVMLVLGILQVAARNHQPTTPNTIEYPKALKWLIYLLWLAIPVMVYLAGNAGKNPSMFAGVLIGIFFLCLVIPLHLEIMFAWITWDEENIYTRSPWRRSRTIPMKDVATSEYLPRKQVYRIETFRHGNVNMSQFMSGIDGLLDALPVEKPEYPPRSVI